MALSKMDSESMTLMTASTSALSLTDFFSSGNDDSLALLSGEGEVYRAELLQECFQLAKTIQTFDQPSWGLSCQNTKDFIVGMLALVLSGKTICLPPNGKPGTLTDLSDHAEMLITDGSGKGFAGQFFSLNSLHELAIDSEDFTFPEKKATFIFFTSGSSGQPKAVIKKLSQLETEIQSLETLWGEELSGSITLSCVAHQHIYGVLFRILWPLLAGRTIHCDQFEYPETLLKEICSHDSVTLIASPAQLDRLPDDLEWHKVTGQLKAIFSSGAPLSANGAETTQNYLGKLPLEVLGSTETGGVAWRQQSPEPGAVHWWHTLPAVKARIEEGLLKVFSPWTDQPEKGYTMGDKAELIGDNAFILKGRADLITKIEGKRVSLSEVSDRLITSELVEEAIAVVLEKKRKQIGVVIILSSAGRAVMESEGRLALSRKLKQTLAYHFEAVTLPRKWRYPSAMPVNSQGKLVRSDLVKLFEATQ